MTGSEKKSRSLASRAALFVLQGPRKPWWVTPALLAGFAYASFQLLGPMLESSVRSPMLVIGFAAALLVTGMAAWWLVFRVLEYDYWASIARSLPSDKCVACGYTLEGIEGSRCPECGIEFTEYVTEARRRIRQDNEAMSGWREAPAPGEFLSPTRVLERMMTKGVADRQRMEWEDVEPGLLEGEALERLLECLRLHVAGHPGAPWREVQSWACEHVPTAFMTLPNVWRRAALASLRKVASERDLLSAEAVLSPYLALGEGRPPDVRSFLRPVIDAIELADPGPIERWRQAVRLTEAEAAALARKALGPRRGSALEGLHSPLDVRRMFPAFTQPMWRMDFRDQQGRGIVVIVLDATGVCEVTEKAAG